MSKLTDTHLLGCGAQSHQVRPVRCGMSLLVLLLTQGPACGRALESLKSFSTMALVRFYATPPRNTTFVFGFAGILLDERVK
eukprot:6059778-Amphidinium_carterae.1